MKASALAANRIIAGDALGKGSLSPIDMEIWQRGVPQRFPILPHVPLHIAWTRLDSRSVLDQESTPTRSFGI